MPLKNRHVFPPGGWQYFQGETGWKMPGGKTFTEAVKSIITHRLSNPRFNLATDVETVSNQLDTYTCFRIGFDPNYCNPEAQKKTSPEPSPLPPTAASVETPQPPVPAPEPPKPSLLAKLAGLSDGARILTDWLGEGATPVAGELAEQRALVCESCPRNVTAKRAFQKLISKIAGAVKEQAEAKSLAELRVPNEDKLGMCNACGCHLPLKVHVPLETILGHTSKTTMEQFPEHCWMVKESK